jgi:hypothetical protein
MRIRDLQIRIRKAQIVQFVILTPEGRGSERPILIAQRLQAVILAMRIHDLHHRIRRPVIVLNVILIQAIHGWV